MSKKNKRKNNKKSAQSGLGRSLDELLIDNDELTNMECKVLMHRNGEMLKIYNKLDSQIGVNAINSAKNHKNNANVIQNSPMWCEKPQKPKILEENKADGIKRETRDDGTEKAQDALRKSLKSSVVDNLSESSDFSSNFDLLNDNSEKNDKLEQGSGLKFLNDDSKNDDSAKDDSKNGDSKTDGGKRSLASALDSLSDYRPDAKDEFLEELRQMSEFSPSKSYKTDKDGRIIINPSSNARARRR